MSKSHRGSGIRELTNKARGKCPICNRTGIKLVYEHEVEGTKLHICKQCRAALAHGK